MKAGSLKNDLHTLYGMGTLEAGFGFRLVSPDLVFNIFLVSCSLALCYQLIMLPG